MPIYAYPRPLPEGDWPFDEVAGLIDRYSGMTLRDYFAAHAPSMPQRMREAAQSMNKRENGRDVFDFAAYAEYEASWRMAYADAMLAARQP